MSAANHKLTALLAGRSIANGTASAGIETIHFADGSQLTIRLATDVSMSIVTAGAIDKVRQSVDPAELYLDLQNGTTFTAQLAEATSCVLLRDANGHLEYAD